MNRDIKEEPDSNMSTESNTSTVSPVTKKPEQEDGATCKSEGTFKKRSLDAPSESPLKTKSEDNPLRKKRKLFDRDSDSDTNIKKKVARQ